MVFTEQNIFMIYQKSTDRSGRIVGELLADVICYHHGGLPDAEDFNGDSLLLMRLRMKMELTDYEQVKVAFLKDLRLGAGDRTAF